MESIGVGRFVPRCAPRMYPREWCEGPCDRLSHRLTSQNVLPGSSFLGPWHQVPTGARGATGVYYFVAFGACKILLNGW